MKPQVRVILAICALLTAACSSVASQRPPTLSPEHPLSSLLENPPSTVTAEKLLGARWEFPLTLVKGDEADVTVEHCEALLEANESGYGANRPSESGVVQATLALCLATADNQKLKPFRHSYLPDPLLSPQFPLAAPAELMVVISESDRATMEQSDSWQEASAIGAYQASNPYEATYTSKDGAIQRVFLLATGDYNGDDIQDAILYLESAVEEGSYVTARYLIVTRESQSGPMTVLKSVWPGT